MKLYGIKTCDSVKKTIKWCQAHDIPFEWIDFKTTPPTESQIRFWCQQLGWKTVLNTQSKTYRELDAALKPVESEDQAVSLMVSSPLLIKRPVIETANACLVGYQEPVFQQLFLASTAKDSAS